MTDLQKLRTKLCRELAQAEYDAKVHTTREARRLGYILPAIALLAISDHAESLRPRYAALMERDQTLGLRAARAVGELFSDLRHGIFDRVIDTERSYRATLLGIHHGIDTAHLLREVAVRAGDTPLVEFCDDLLAERERLLADAQQALAYFADEPELAIRSGFRAAMTSEPVPAQAS